MKQKKQIVEKLERIKNLYMDYIPEKNRINFLDKQVETASKLAGDILKIIKKNETN